MTSENDPLAQSNSTPDLSWTLKDIDSKRTLVINKDYLPKLIELGLVEMREGTPSSQQLVRLQHGNGK